MASAISLDCPHALWGDSPHRIIAFCHLSLVHSGHNTIDEIKLQLEY
jgi:hypothetical protein